MASLSDFQKKVRNTKNRQSQIFLRVEEWDGTNSEIDYSFVNMGRVSNASISAEPVASDADQDGRESSQLFDITATLTLMQGSNEELSQLSELALPSDPNDNGLYPNGHSIYVSGTNQVKTSDVNAALTDDDTAGEGANEAIPDFGTGAGQLDDPDGLFFENVLLKPSAEINLDGGTTLITLEFTGRVGLDELSDLDTTQVITISPE